MAKVIAISLESPFGMALSSLQNCFKAVGSFMYGTKERASYTYAFAFGLAILGGVLNMVDTTSMLVCH